MRPLIVPQNSVDYYIKRQPAKQSALSVDEAEDLIATAEQSLADNGIGSHRGPPP